jgi:hypothetical protein
MLPLHPAPPPMPARQQRGAAGAPAGRPTPARGARAQAVFFVPYLSLSNFRERPLDDVNALGKTMFIAMIGVVSLEVALVSRFWTGWFVAAWLLSWALCFPWLILLGMIYSAIRAYDSAMARRPRCRACAVLAQGCAPGRPDILAFLCPRAGMRCPCAGCCPGRCEFS